jgi:hypothetical protein
MNKLLITIGLLLTAAVSASAQIAQGGDYRLEQAVVASGGGTSADAGGVYSLTGTAGQALAGTRSTGSPYILVGGFYPAIFYPTAASVNLEGRILNAEGRGIRNVRITLTESNGATRTFLSGAFGNYRFGDIAAGQTVTVSVFAKSHRFEETVRVIAVTEDLTGVDFVGNSLKKP